MHTFTPFSRCPICHYGTSEVAPPNKTVVCKAQATDVPLRCAHSADPAQLANWPQEKFEKDGLYYKPVIKVVVHKEEREAANPDFKAELEVSETNQPTRMVPFDRPENVLDEEATIAAGPIAVPTTVKHVHRTCLVCSNEWVEALP